MSPVEFQSPVSQLSCLMSPLPISTPGLNKQPYSFLLCFSCDNKRCDVHWGHLLFGRKEFTSTVVEHAANRVQQSAHPGTLSAREKGSHFAQGPAPSQGGLYPMPDPCRGKMQVDSERSSQSQSSSHIRLRSQLRLHLHPTFSDRPLLVSPFPSICVPPKSTLS